MTVGARAATMMATIARAPINSINVKPFDFRMGTDGHGEGAGSDRKTVHLTCGLPAVTLIPCPSVLMDVLAFRFWFLVLWLRTQCSRSSCNYPPGLAAAINARMGK